MLSLDDNKQAMVAASKQCIEENRYTVKTGATCPRQKPL